MPALPNNSLSISVVCYQSDRRELEELIASILSCVAELRSRQPDGENLGSRSLEDRAFVNNELDPASKPRQKKAKLGKGGSPKTVPLYLIDNSERNELSLTDLEDCQQQADMLGVEFRLLHGHGNVGYGAAHNLIINNLDAGFHLMLNPDVVLGKQFLSEGINYLIDHDDVVLAVPMANHENGDRQFLCKRYPSVLTLFIRGFLPSNLHKFFTKRLTSYEMRDLRDDQINKDIPTASGCCMLSRGSALTAVNGFDERYFLYFEDFDLSLRIRQQGSIAYIPAMKIIHRGGYSARKGFDHIRMFARSAIRFFNTYGWRWFKQ